MTGKMKMNRIRTISGGWLLLPVILLAACGDAPRWETIERAVVNGRLAGEAFARSHRFVEGWLAVADTVTGLIPKNLQGDYFWNAQDAAADNYPFMVITSFYGRRAFPGQDARYAADGDGTDFLLGRLSCNL